MRHRSPDFWSGLALAALGAYIVAQARGWDYLTDDGPGPGFFPLWYGIAILACSAWLVVFGKSPGADWRGAGRALGTWAAVALSVGAVAFFVVAVMYRRPPAVAALVALCTVAGFYLVFPFALGVALP